MNKLINPYPKNLWVIQIAPSFEKKEQSINFEALADPQVLAVLKAFHAISGLLTSEILKELVKVNHMIENAPEKINPEDLKIWNQAIEALYDLIKKPPERDKGT